MNKPFFIKIFFLCVIVCCACKNFTKNNSSEILPLDSVAVIVADCYFIESEIYVRQRAFDMKDYAILKYDSLFAKHGITKETFVKNVKYYFTSNKYSEKIMNKVDEIVEKRVAALRDSLNINK